MGRFNSIYPFTSENIAGYMKDLDLTGKKVITVTGSTDHILNAILQGATEITTFDINPLTKPYMDLKISALKNLSYKNFIKLLLFESNINLDYSIISSLNDLKIDEHFDYMFLSNISDYLNLMYSSDRLQNYRDLLKEFQKKIDIIYFAYLYDIGNSNPRTEIDDLRKVKEIFFNFQQVEFKSALEGSSQDKKDGVLILKRGGK